ncbi:MAG: cell division protein ZipA [Lysobacteraceae bacterium]
MDVSWNPTVAALVAAAGVILLGLIYVFGQPRRADQGRRLFARKPAPARREPSLDGEAGALSAEDIEAELASLERVLAGQAEPADEDGAPAPDFEKIVALHVAAREGEVIRGDDLVVAAEKAGLSFGAMNIFHRSVDGRPGQPPIFSVANMLKPGTFDLRQLDQLETPGLSFFMTLPGPLSGLDAWDAMLPAAQRMAELLDAVVLDDRRNALGRQRIAHLRDELRAWDRQREQTTLGKPW